MSFIRELETPVVLVDLDEFKTVNDTAGHDAGDRLLKEVGAILREENVPVAYA